jgi:hypothetical protein
LSFIFIYILFVDSVFVSKNDKAPKIENFMLMSKRKTCLSVKCLQKSKNYKSEKLDFAQIFCLENDLLKSYMVYILKTKNPFALL